MTQIVILPVEIEDDVFDETLEDICSYISIRAEILGLDELRELELDKLNDYEFGEPIH